MRKQLTITGGCVHKIPQVCQCSTKLAYLQKKIEEIYHTETLSINTPQLKIKKIYVWKRKLEKQMVQAEGA
jgi:hypothetical protein